jgi:EEF1A lysine methyltransferase 2
VDPRPAVSILDLGTGNGSTLFKLRLSGNFTGPMLGVDYSPQSILLARSLAKRYASIDPRNQCANVQFEVLDLIHSDPATQPWWPGGGFDLVLDKGTFDAISLSSETITFPASTQYRVCELYPGKVLKMVKPGGFLLVTSCNWTEEEVVHWFTGSEGFPGSVESVGKLEVWGKVKYPKYKFGGQEGQGVASICFRRVS